MDGLSSMSAQISANPVSPVSATSSTTPGGGQEAPQNGLNRQSNGPLQATMDSSSAFIKGVGLADSGSEAAMAQTSPDKASKPSVTIPPMNRMNSQTFKSSSSSAITPSSTNSPLRRISKQTSVSSLVPTRPAPPSPMISNPPSRRVSQALSTASSSTTHSPQRSPSHKNSSSSIRKSFANDATGAVGALKVSSSRQQSTLVISFTAPTADGAQEIADSPVEASENAVLPQADAPEETDKPTPAPPPQKPIDPLSAIGGKKVDQEKDDNDDTPLRRNFSSTSASTSGASTNSSSSNPVLRHANELEAAYGIAPSTHPLPSLISTRSTRSGSASGAHTPLFSTRPRSIIQSMWGNRTRTTGEGENGNDAPAPSPAASAASPPSATTTLDAVEASPNPADDDALLHETVSKLAPAKADSEAELADANWARANAILVQDFGFDEDDERFTKVPVQALLLVLRPPPDESGPAAGSSRQRRTSGGRAFSSGRGPHYGGGAQYGGRWGTTAYGDWDEDEFDDEDDDDGWGFPMGTVSGGPEPLGTQLLGSRRSRRELRNRSRAWAGLGGSRGVGGKVANEESSEAESSGFYEEDDTREGPATAGGVGANDDDDDDYGFGGSGSAQHTPSRTYHAFLAEENDYTHVDHARAHGDVDGVDADDDEGDSTDYEDVGRRRRREEPEEPEEEEVRPGVYRVLFSFEAESDAEMSVVEGQTIRVLGQGGDGWAVALRTWSFEDRGLPRHLMDGELDDIREEEHGLVPLGYLEPFNLDEDGAP